MERGISLSLHATVTNWGAVRSATARFASITITDNLTWSDIGAEPQVEEAQVAGMRAGIRHYARPGAAGDQAHHCASVGKRLGVFVPGALAPTLDVEAEGVDDRFIRTWIKTV